MIASTPRRTRLLLGLLLLTMTAGCHRSFYRQRADGEAYCLIDEKINPECWPVGRYNIDIDPLSRMFDPFDLDCPPIPPDDPASHQLLQCVDCKRGYPCWGACGARAEVQGPHWRDSLPYLDGNAVELDPDTAVRLALLHSPVYQGNLESLYLSALDVSFERFQFDTLFFSGYSTFFNSTGRDRAGAPSNALNLSTNTSSGGNSIFASRLFATGAQLMVGFANRVMWEFSGPDTRMGTTLIDFSLIQPLLRGGGRDVVLENLTFSERALLANVRQMERFRRQFYVEIMTGRTANDRPLPGGIALNVLNRLTDTSGIAAGYLGLLQDAQDIRNQRSNIASLQSSVAQLEAFFLAGRIDLFQVEFSRQALFNAQRQLLNSERNLASAKDRFKITLGLPPYIDLRLDDELIQPFQLVDPSIIPLQNEITRLQEQVGEATNEIIAMAEGADLPSAGPKSNGVPNVDGSVVSDGADITNEQKPSIGLTIAKPKLVWNPEVGKRLEQVRRWLAETRDILKQVEEDNIPEARKDVEKLRGSVGSRVASAARLRKRLEKRLKERKEIQGSGQVTEADIEGLLPFDGRRLRQLPSILDDTIVDVVKQLGLSENALDELDGQITKLIEQGPQLTPEELYQRLRKEVFTSVPSELNNIAATVLSLILVQARARTESVSLPATDMTWEQALEVARGNRLDWMNARAALVDTWRDIQVTANDLENQLDLIVEGDIGNVGSDSFDLRPSNGEIRVGLQLDAPLIRVAERNTFRAAQIAFQQARRSYYQFEDGVTASLRDIIRRMDINEINFELNRAGIEVAISQVELSRFRLQEPPKPDVESSFSPTTARDLVSALADLLNVQNDFLNLWVSQEVLRRILDLDMGTMRLDGYGQWIDPRDMSGLDRLPSTEEGTSELPDQKNQQPEKIPPPPPEERGFILEGPGVMDPVRDQGR